MSDKPNPNRLRRIVRAVRETVRGIAELERGRPEWIAAGRPKPRTDCDTGPR